MVSRGPSDRLLLGERACLGLVVVKPVHGFAIAGRLAPSGDIGRVWSMSRALTYRAVDQLVARELIVAGAEERGIAGGTRTILAPTRRGRMEHRRWLAEPVAHLRDLRSELLLKLVLGDLLDVDRAPLLRRQLEIVAQLTTSLVQHASEGDDVVAVWRSESSQGALRFLERLLDGCSETR